MKKDDSYWRSRLSDEQFRIARKKGTEPPFTGKYNDFKKDGRFVCICCGEELFDSADKYDSGSGWPSFTRSISDTQVIQKRDTSHGMIRTEVLCATCDAHLGHLFTDGPAPTGKRYCINSASLDFKPESGEPDD